jgi:large subunit ribosomal protein L15
MKLHDLQPAEGSRKRNKRVGRGIAAGQGKSAGRGTKGQKARSGGAKPPYFEGGQLPLVRRFPWRRGFHAFTRVECTPVNVGRLEVFAAGSLVTPVELAERGIIRKSDVMVKILAEGDLSKRLRVRAHRFSEAAREKIAAAGGEVEVIE